MNNLMSPHSPVVLRAGRLVAHVHPSCGARVGRFFQKLDDGRDFDFFMPLAQDAFDRHVWPKAGCFPMLPYVDKLVGNALQWEGQTIQVADADAPPWFHGWGLRSEWEVMSATGTACEMRLHMAAGSRWPWEIECRMAVTLDAAGLSIALSVTNLSAATMPASLGIHPYFRWPEGTHAEAHGELVLIADTERPGSYRVYHPDAARAWLAGDMESPASPPNLFYEGWDRSARISYREAPLALRITSDDARCLTTFAPKNGMGYVCLEPGTQLPGRFGDGVAAGKTLQLQACFRPE